MPQYRIQPGGRFRMPDGSVKEAGSEIELEADVAAMHPTTVVLIPATQAVSASDMPAAEAHQE